MRLGPFQKLEDNLEDVNTVSIEHCSDDCVKVLPLVESVRAYYYISKVRDEVRHGAYPWLEIDEDSYDRHLYHVKLCLKKGYKELLDQYEESIL